MFIHRLENDGMVFIFCIVCYKGTALHSTVSFPPTIKYCIPEKTTVAAWV